MVGLLTPSGIAADKGAAEFFRTHLNRAGWRRLAALFDFENKKVFFPDIDAASNSAPWCLAAAARRFTSARCAFYLHSVDELADPERVLTLTGADFLRVNPNTGAAPIFRTRRDAEITTRDLSPAIRCWWIAVRADAKKVWPVRYCQRCST